MSVGARTGVARRAQGLGLVEDKRPAYVTDVVVVGSANRDLVLAVPSLPVAGETVLGSDRRLGCGGKGANQAVAAAAAGAQVAFVGCVGDDADGVALRQGLADAGIDTSLLFVDPKQPTGLAVVLVSASGENLIAVAPGANHALSASYAGDADGISRIDAAIGAARVLLVQLEIPLDVVNSVVGTAHTAGVDVVLNLSPTALLPPELLSRVSVLVVNRVEAEFLLGRPVPGSTSLQAAADELRRLGPAAVVVTGGAEGAGCAYDGTMVHVPAPSVPVVDTTGAGDAFAGTFAAALARGSVDLVQAVEEAVAAGAAAVQRPGAQ